MRTFFGTRLVGSLWNAILVPGLISTVLRISVPPHVSDIDLIGTKQLPKRVQPEWSGREVSFC